MTSVTYPAITARHYFAEEILRSGLRVTIRAARPDSARIAKIDFVNEVMLVATMQFDSDEIVIGGACYIANDIADGLREARVAFTIEEPYQGLGIADQLLKHLARSHGYTALLASPPTGRRTTNQCRASSSAAACRYGAIDLTMRRGSRLRWRARGPLKLQSVADARANVEAFN